MYVCFGIDVGGVKRPNSNSNATIGSMFTFAITCNRFGDNKSGFGSKFTLTDHFSSVCHCGSVRLCALHQTYVTDIVALTPVI